MHPMRIQFDLLRMHIKTGLQQASCERALTELPTLATIRFESGYLLCHVNVIDMHPMRIQFDLLRMHIKTGLQQASCECALTELLSISQLLL